MKETLILIALVTSVALESVDFRRFLIYRMSVTERQDREIVEIQKKDQESLLHSSQGSLARIHTPSFDAVRLSHFAEAVEVATRWVRHYGVNITVNHKFRPTAELSCPLERFELDCDPESKYRTLSGRCNNLDNARWGGNTVLLTRLLPSEYDDGIARPKIRSQAGGHLPNVRQISNAVHREDKKTNKKQKKNQKHTLMLMQWGQFVDHDLTLTPMHRGEEGAIIDCSRCDSNRLHRGCYPILVPTGDEHFPTKEDKSPRRKCIPFTRSIPGQADLGPREQVNLNTAYLDASHLYGSTPCRMKQIRDKKGGRMMELKHPHSHILKSLLPTTVRNKECRSMMGFCFNAGDDRSNEQPGLTSMHTVLMREHNRLADQLAIINPDWNDETLFEEARRIVMAENQHITYNEFLPRVLGPDLMDFFDLNILEEGYYSGYNQTCNPDVSNEFATAAFRFGHSMISPMFAMMTRAMKELPDRVELKEHFHNPDVVYNIYFIDKLVRGLATHPIENPDAVLSASLTDHLFEEKHQPFSGMDLAALNLQRGRDHGLPGYTKYRAYCMNLLGVNEKRITSFQDLTPIMGAEAVKQLSSIYQHVDDIDLFAGGMAELPVTDGVVGETFGCIIGEQFDRIKRCDRFWFETDDPIIKFTPDQLNEIRKTTLASLVCHNCDIPSRMPRMVMDMEDEKTNSGSMCTDHAKLDVMHWARNNERQGRNEATANTIPKLFCEFDGRTTLIGQEMRVSACKSCYCGQDEEFCKTLHVESCDQLQQEVGRAFIESDEDCYQQCPINKL